MPGLFSYGVNKKRIFANMSEQGKEYIMRSKYETNVAPYFDWIEAWCRDGIAEHKIAEKLNVSYASFREYKAKYPALSAILARTKEYVDLVEMVGAYKRRAEGYTVEEKTIRYKYVKRRDGTIEKVPVGESVTQKHIPGDPRAMENWLRLRQKEMWRDAIDVEEGSSGGGVIVIPKIEVDEYGNTED